MRTWATASLFVAGLLWLEVESSPQLFQNLLQTSGIYRPQLRVPRKQQQFRFFYLKSGRPGDVAPSHSVLGLQPQQTLLTHVDFPGRIPRYHQNDPIDNADSLYKNFEENFEKNLEQTQTFPFSGANDRNGYEAQTLANGSGYVDHKTSQTTHLLGPHQIETIDSEHFHKEVPAFDISGYQQHTSEKHGEVHYHQHKHIHKHEHKQEHVHQHKQDHQHKHLHNQQHKHEHHSDHKHGHQHKHQHHQQHKHDHGHEHKHENRHEHKHQHGHKHQHHSENKHQHQHGHKHGHGHKHHHSKHH